MNGSQKRGHGQDHRRSRHDSHEAAGDGLLSEAAENQRSNPEPREHTHGLGERPPAGTGRRS